MVFGKKNYNRFKLHYRKQSVDDNSIQRSVRTTKQIFYDNGLFQSFPNADRTLKDFMFVPRRKANLEGVIYVIQ